MALDYTTAPTVTKGSAIDSRHFNKLAEKAGAKIVGQYWTIGNHDGVLILEAMAQATGLLAFRAMGDDYNSKLYMLVGIDKARFRSQVTPGDQLDIEITLKRTMRGIGVYACQARVDGKPVADAEMMCSAQERES